MTDHQAERAWRAALTNGPVETFTVSGRCPFRVESCDGVMLSGVRHGTSSLHGTRYNYHYSHIRLPAACAAEAA